METVHPVEMGWANELKLGFVIKMSPSTKFCCVSVIKKKKVSNILMKKNVCSSFEVSDREDEVNVACPNIRSGKISNFQNDRLIKNRKKSFRLKQNRQKEMSIKFRGEICLLRRLYLETQK